MKSPKRHRAVDRAIATGLASREAKTGDQAAPKALDSRPVDYVLSAARAAVGPIPIVGPLLTELVGVVVPHQRVDRIAKFVVELERRIEQLESPERIREQFANETFTDLLEEGFRQAAHSLSDERRRYIASLICSSLPAAGIQSAESKHLLRILNEVNDIEIVWLRYYREPTMGGDEDFRNRHAEVLRPAIATYGSSPGEADKSTLQDSYKEHLSRLNLLKPRYELDPETNQPKFGRIGGQQKINDYQITRLGRLLLREIGLGDDG